MDVASVVTLGFPHIYSPACRFLRIVWNSSLLRLHYLSICYRCRNLLTFLWTKPNWVQILIRSSSSAIAWTSLLSRAHIQCKLYLLSMWQLSSNYHSQPKKCNPFQSRYQQLAYIALTTLSNKEIVIGRCGIRECMHSKMLHLLMCSWLHS